MLKRLGGMVPRFRGRWLALYVLLLVLSNLVAMNRARVVHPEALGAGAVRGEVMLPAMSDAGPVAGAMYRMSYVRWDAAASDEPAPGVVGRMVDRVKEAVGAGPVEPVPIFLLHGAPSRGGRDFDDLAPLLAARGSTVFALDLPGSGRSDRRAPSYSIQAAGRLVIAAMEELKIPQAHLVGWSQGGGAAMVAADLAPERAASLTLLGSIGMQETEGSGSYGFEHFKYRIGHVLLTVVPELLPHFGLLGKREDRWVMLRPFMDTDLRPMKGLMERLRTPTMILHGRHDFLVAAWAAEEHHKVIGPSTLVMLDAGHFVPLGPPMGDEAMLREGAAHLHAFMSLHDEAGRTGLRGMAVLCPPEAHITQKLGGFEVRHGMPWWLITIVITLATFISEDLTTITVGLLIVSQSIDWGVGLVGCFLAILLGDVLLWLLGRTLGRRALKLPLIRGMVTEQSLVKWGKVLDEHTGKAVLFSRCLPGTRMPTFIAAGIMSRKPHVFLLWVALAAFLWTPFLLTVTMLVGPSFLGFFKSVFHGPWAIVAAVVAMYIVIRLIGYETTAMGRDRLKADLKRFVTPEFWPAWVFYLPLLPGWLWMALRSGGLMTFTCANPGIEPGGGMVGESKGRILRGLARGENAKWVAAWELIEAGAPAEVRAARALASIQERPELGGFPIILKPDDGARGFAVKLARNERDVMLYFRMVTGAVLVQKFHPGPYEIGILWSRVMPGAGKNGSPDGWRGEIFSATGKEFPVIVGDGKRTLELLVWHHPRYRMQADMFLKRHAEQMERVLGEGETLALAMAGNHCQGTKFYDGMPAVTHELAARIEEIAQRFEDPERGGRLDFGRFDIRYASEAELARGEGFLIVELNGTSSESTSMYDPSKSLAWTYGLLYRHWSRVYRLGAARKREGRRPMGLVELIGAWRRHRRGRTGSRISD